MTLFDDEQSIEELRPPGLIYFANWLSIEEHDLILNEIDCRIFDTTLSRRVQHYGTIYDYAASTIGRVGNAPAIPPLMSKLATRLEAEGLFDRIPDQVIVNEYIAGQGIARHIDKDSFGPQVATISLCESWQMDFLGPNGEMVAKILERCSLTVMTGDSRYKWKHQIAKRKSDVIGRNRVQRKRRISLTFRTIETVR